MRSILVDLKSGQVFSEEHGWNYAEASVRDSDWSKIIYGHTGPISSTNEKLEWKDRTLVYISLPMEPEILT